MKIVYLYVMFVTLNDKYRHIWNAVLLFIQYTKILEKKLFNSNMAHRMRMKTAI